MIAVTVLTARQQIRITGHTEDERACGALTALMRAFGCLSVRSHFEPGMSAVEVNLDYPADFAALVYGVECIIAKCAAAMITYDPDEPKQIL